MNELIQQLKELAEVDRTILETREQLARYPVSLAKMQAAEDERRRTIEETDAALRQTQAARRQTDKEVAVLRDKIKKYASQQAVVKTNKEYEAITHEMAGLRDKIDELDSAGLTMLEQEERAAARRKEAETQLARLTAEHEGERRRIAELTAEKTERAARLTSERQRRLAALPDNWQEEYTLLNERYPGAAVAPLSGENCGGCHWALVPHTRQLVRKGEEPIRCEHCKRVLYASA